MIAFYIDNVLVAKEIWKADQLKSNENYNLRIGIPSNQILQGNFFQGLMDELKIYDVSIHEE